MFEQILQILGGAMSGAVLAVLFINLLNTTGVYVVGLYTWLVEDFILKALPRQELNADDTKVYDNLAAEVSRRRKDDEEQRIIEITDKIVAWLRWGDEAKSESLRKRRRECQENAVNQMARRLRTRSASSLGRRRWWIRGELARVVVVASREQLIPALPVQIRRLGEAATWWGALGLFIAVLAWNVVAHFSSTAVFGDYLANGVTAGAFAGMLALAIYVLAIHANWRLGRLSTLRWKGRMKWFGEVVGLILIFSFWTVPFHLVPGR